MVSSLSANWADVNAKGGDYSSAIQATTWGGHTETARLLVDSDADVNAQGGYYGSALQAAAEEGHTEMAQLLQSFGALEISADGTV